MTAETRSWQPDRRSGRSAPRAERGVVHAGPQELFGVTVHIEASSAVRGTMSVPDGVLDDRGGVPPGLLGVLVDDVLGYAILSRLPMHCWTVSTDIWIDCFPDSLVGPGELEARMRSVRAGRVSTYACGDVRAANGALVAVCRQRARVSPMGAPKARPDGFGGDESPAAVGQPAGDLAHRLGLIPDDHDNSVALLPVGPGLANPSGVLHGGVSLAATDALASRYRARNGVHLPTVSVHISHLRPVATGESLRLNIEPLRAGRTTWLADVVGRVGDKVATLTRVSAHAQ